MLARPCSSPATRRQGRGALSAQRAARRGRCRARRQQALTFSISRASAFTGVPPVHLGVFAMNQNIAAAKDDDEIVFKIKRSAIADALRSDFEMPIPVTDANIEVVVNQITALIDEFPTASRPSSSISVSTTIRESISTVESMICSATSMGRAAVQHGHLRTAPSSISPWRTRPTASPSSISRRRP